MTPAILSQTDGLGTAGRSENDRSDATTTHLGDTALRSSLDPDENASDIPRRPVILATDPRDPLTTWMATRAASTTRTRLRNDHEGSTKQSPSYYSPSPIDERMYGERTGVRRSYDY
jgi:hypothetical protein